MVEERPEGQAAAAYPAAEALTVIPTQAQSRILGYWAQAFTGVTACTDRIGLG